MLLSLDPKSESEAMNLTLNKEKAARKKLKFNEECRWTIGLTDF